MCPGFSVSWVCLGLLRTGFHVNYYPCCFTHKILAMAELLPLIAEPETPDLSCTMVAATRGLEEDEEAEIPIMALSVSTEDGEISNGTDSDGQKLVADEDENDHEDQETDCYESDYEYCDEEEEDTKDDEETDSVTPGDSLKKRKNDGTPPFPCTKAQKSPPRSSRRQPQGNLKTTGLDDTDDYEFNNDIKYVPSFPHNVPQANGDELIYCGICQQEEHKPVLDCAMVGSWLELRQDKAAGVLSVEPCCIVACMNRRVREVMGRLQRIIEGEFTLDRIMEEAGSPLHAIFGTIYGIRNADMAAVELRRHRWDAQALIDSYIRRARLEIQLNPADFMPGERQVANLVGRRARRHVPPHLRPAANRMPALVRRHVGLLDFDQNDAGLNDYRDNAEVRRAIDQLEIDQSLMQEEDTTNQQQTGQENMDRNRQYERSVQQVLSDHQAFLQSTMGGTQQGNPTQNSSAQNPPSGSSSPFGKATAMVSDYLVKPVVQMMGLTTSPDARTASVELTGGSNAAAAAAQQLTPNTVRGSDDNPQLETTSHETARAHAPSPVSATRRRLFSKPTWTCEICFDDEVSEDDRLSMGCGHEYCRDCWVGYIQVMLDETRQTGGILTRTTTCPHRLCRRKLSRSHVDQFAPIALPTYDEMALNSFVEGHGTTMRWCPGVGCGLIAVRSREGLFDIENNEVVNSVRCEGCKTRYCFACGDPPHNGPCVAIATGAVAVANVEHAPQATPEERNFRAAREGLGFIQDALPRIDDSQATDKRIRLCPKCKVPIEKNGGW